MVKPLYNSLIVAPLKNLVDTFPNKIVLYHKNKSLTALELFTNSCTIAQNLLTINFKRNDIAVIAMQPGKDFLELMYALLILRAKIAIIDPEMGRDNYAAKLKQLSPQWMFVDSRLLFLNEHQNIKNLLFKVRKNIPDINFKTDASIISVGMFLPLSRKNFTYKSLKKLVSDDVQLIEDEENFDNLIVYTSGTLSEPKGVLHSTKSLSTTIDLLTKIIGAKLGDSVGTYLPHFMLLGIASGLAVKIMAVKLKAKQKLTWLIKQEINIFFGPPSELLPLIIYCENNNIKFPSTLKHIMLGSAPVHQGFLNRLVSVLPETTKITCTYGMTEHLLVAIADGREKIKYLSTGDYLGKIVETVEVKIADDKEIFVKSEQMYSRYLHLNNRDDWHATGDLGAIDNLGRLILLGRKKEMIIRKDFNIYPAIYESTIKKIQGVNDAVFVGIYKEDIHDEKVYLAIEGEIKSANFILKHLEKGEFSIDKSAIPDEIIFLNLPRKGRQNKVDKESIVNYILQHNL